MSKRYRNLSLASTPNEWDQVEQTVNDLVDHLCDHGVYEDAEKLFALLDLMWNDSYAQGDREIVAHTAIKRAFSMTEAAEAAMKAEAARINPVAIRKVA